MDVEVLPNPLAPLNPVDLTVPEAERSTVPDWVQLRAKVVLEGNETRETLFWFEALHADLTISETGLVRVKPGAIDGMPTVRIIPVADPAKSRVLPIPVKRQGDLSFIIQ
ncbi:hypothetical protein D3C72_1880620 [compost metagenome]